MPFPSSVVPTRGVSLYELGEEWRALEAALLDTGGEVTPEVEAAFTALGDLEGRKVDAYAQVVRQLAAYGDALKVEETELRAKRKTAEAAVDRLKARLLDYLRERGMRELRGPVWRAVIQKNGGLRPMELLVPPEDLPARFQVVTVAPNWPEIRAALGETLPPDQIGAQVTVPGCDAPVVEVRPVGEHLRFR